MEHQELWYDTVSSPVGQLKIVASDKGVAGILWEKDAEEEFFPQASIKRSQAHACVREAKSQLKEYFQRRRTQFQLPLDPRGTSFQLKSWEVLKTIPYGETISYAEQARRLGDVKKARAVGMANGKNPISIIVPCHRVIGKSGNLTGFGGGLNAKQFLLELEKKK